jgi:hypothetical protein
MALRIRNNKDIKGFQIKIDEQTHSIKISQLADDTTPFQKISKEIFSIFESCSPVHNLADRIRLN